MSNKYGRPRPDGLLLYEAHRKAVAYRLALVSALRELNPHNCGACRRAQQIIESVDRVETPPRPVVPAQRVDPDHVSGQDDLTMTTFDVAIAFGVHTSTVEDWVKNDRIPSFLDDKGRRLFDTATIDTLLA